MAKLDFNKMVVLAKVSHCKFVDFVVPGDKLICSIKLLICNRGFTVNQAEITRDGVVIAKAELRMKVLDFFCELAKEPSAILDSMKARPKFKEEYPNSDASGVVK